jgi:hypothetical protein
MAKNRHLRFTWISLLVLVMLAAPGGRGHADVSFPQTGQRIWGPFEEYWKQHGGLAQFGMPRTSVFPAGNGYDAQWFERALFTYTPANPDPYKVQLDLLGTRLTEKRRNEAPFQPTRQIAGSQFFGATGHNLSGKFLQYWQQTGSLPVYGYPISEPFTERSRADGKEYLVQYFERNRFELHPEMVGTQFEVQLGLLGSELLDAQGGPSAFANRGAGAYYPKPSGVTIPPGGVVGAGGSQTPGPATPTAIPAAPSLPATSRPVLFQTDFSSPDLSAWQPTDRLGETTESLPGWRVKNGVLEQSGTLDVDTDAEEALLVLTSPQLSDFTLDTYFWGTSGEPVGVVLRLTEAGYYVLKLYGATPNSSPKAELLRVTKSGGVAVASSVSWEGYQRAAWQRLTVAATGTSFTISIDGKRVLDGVDTTYKQGSFGFYAYADDTAKFDNLRITSP